MILIVTYLGGPSHGQLAHPKTSFKNTFSLCLGVPYYLGDILFLIYLFLMLFCSEFIDSIMCVAKEITTNT